MGPGPRPQQQRRGVSETRAGRWEDQRTGPQIAPGHSSISISSTSSEVSPITPSSLEV